MDNLNDFKKIFSWYRNLSIELLKQLPEEKLNDQISSRSLPVRCQIIDLGDMQLKTVERMGARNIGHFQRPNEKTATKEEIIAYLTQTLEATMKILETMDPATTTLDWFGRMKFNFQEALAFLLAHEAMHHGEILSFIFAKDVEMPKAFKSTWGFEL